MADTQWIYEVAAALEEPQAADLAARALAEAEEAGHLMTVPRLQTLAGKAPKATGVGRGGLEPPTGGS